MSKKIKFKLGQRLTGIRSGKEYRVVGIDRTEGATLNYLVERFDGGGIVLEWDWLKLCTDLLPNIPDGIRGGWMDQSDLVEMKLIPDGPVYTPDLRVLAQDGVSGDDKETDVYVRRFKSGAIRSDDRGRENPAFISPYALKFLAQHFSKNAAFFNNGDSAKNYMKGIEPIDIEGSLARHYVEFGFAMMPNRRENLEPIKQALVELMANCVMGLHQIGLAEDGEYVELFTKTEYIKK